MSNMKSFIFVLLIFAVFGFPYLLTITIDTFQQQYFMKVTTEIPELIKAEGGISPLVKEMTNKIERTGIQITYSQSDVVRFGEEIVIHYQYEYPNVKGLEQLETQNTVTVMKRE
ncbi:hypothetical protein P9B03_02155 [Metasolibacillus meyeri]|uniref:DUF4845 domain-containing protein n=1 Tax=Metasolibacillus meyeri TaxID=1071052 RepID=A0AAW9NFK6_9BACL|nr:hypothetical protein [Metasolibacillus meyeri]MEC1177274.1 hypothetical protein [Metasolibacillus meyeri]